MSDNEAIIRLLMAVRRRTRRNRIVNETAAGLSIALLLPVGFKLLDLVSPFRATTVSTFLSIWAASVSIWLIWRIRGSGTLESAASQIDQRTQSHDEFSTAYWFLRNPKPSPWIDAQIKRAA